MHKVNPLTIRTCLTSLLLSSWLSVELQGARPSDSMVDSTLEVLRGAQLAPSDRMVCGPACLYIAVKYFGSEEYSLGDIAEMAGWNHIDGTNMLGLQNACEKMGLYAEAFELNTQQLEKLMRRNNALAIIENMSHFYLLMKADDGKFLLVTTPVEPKWINAAEMAEVWDRKALLFSKQYIDAGNMPTTALLLLCVGGALLVILTLGYLLKKHYNSTGAKLGASAC